MDTLDWIVMGGMATFVIGLMILKAWERAHDFFSGPLLLAEYVRGAGLVKMADGKVEGLPYLFMATTGGPGYEGMESGSTPTLSTNKLSGIFAEGLFRLGVKAQQQAREGHGIMYIQLPYQSDVHILSHGGKDSEFEALLRRTQLNNSVVPVVLEGDFPSYFNLYCDRNHEVELRQVLDPATMAFLVDFCAENDWELYQDHLYMVRRPGVIAGNDTPLPEDAQTFAKRILPTLKSLSHHA